MKKNKVTIGKELIKKELIQVFESYTLYSRTKEFEFFSKIKIKPKRISIICRNESTRNFTYIKILDISIMNLSQLKSNLGLGRIDSLHFNNLNVNWDVFGGNKPLKFNCEVMETCIVSIMIHGEEV